jgi:hypothetical protein
MRDKKKGSALKLNPAIPQIMAHTRCDEARQGERAGGRGGGACAREPSSHMLMQHGEEPTLYISLTLPKLARWD